MVWKVIEKPQIKADEVLVETKTISINRIDVKISPHVSVNFPFEQTADTHLQIESGRTVGKAVVTL